MVFFLIGPKPLWSKTTVVALILFSCRTKSLCLQNWLNKIFPRKINALLAVGKSQTVATTRTGKIIPVKCKTLSKMRPPLNKHKHQLVKCSALHPHGQHEFTNENMRASCCSTRTLKQYNWSLYQMITRPLFTVALQWNTHVDWDDQLRQTATH